MRELSDTDFEVLLPFFSAGDWATLLVTLFTLSLTRAHDGENLGTQWKRAARADADQPLDLRHQLDRPLDECRSVSTYSLLRALDDATLYNRQSHQPRRINALLGERSSYWLVSKVPPRTTRSVRTPDSPHALANFHIIPQTFRSGEQTLHIDLTAASATLNGALVASEPLGYVGHFDTHCDLSITHHAATNEFTLGGIGTPELRRGEAEQHAAAAAGARFFVLPECTLMRGQRHPLARYLSERAESPCLSLLGSFPESDGSVSGCIRNDCELIDYRGATLFSHSKTARAQMGAGIGAEGITTGNTLHVLATDIGLVGVAICIEFCGNVTAHAQAWQRIAAEWMLVPSMGAESTLVEHRSAADALHRNHKTVSLVANQSSESTAQWPGFAVVDKSGPISNAHNRLLALENQTTNSKVKLS